MVGNNRGVTLVELMTAVTIMIVVMLPVSLVFNSGNKTYYIENDTMAAQEEAREAMGEIIESLRKNDSQDIKVESGELIVESDTLIYAMVDNTIVRKNIISGENTTVCSDVEAFTVTEESTGYDTKLIEIEIKTQIGKGRGIVLQNSYRIKSK